MRTLEEKLIADGAEVPALVACHSCQTELPSFAVSEDGYCGHCIIEAKREVIAEKESSTDPFTFEWNSEFGNLVRAERNQFLDKWRWTLFPDSPLSTDCQAQFGDLFVEINRLSLDYKTPYEAREALKNVVIPQIEYAA